MPVPGKTDQVTLFVYNSDGKLVMTRTKSIGDLQGYKGINLNLPNGEYYRSPGRT